MKLQKTHTEMIRADISKEERTNANRLAKSKGMTFQGFVGQLIKNELKKSEAEEVSDGNRN